MGETGSCLETTMEAQDEATRKTIIKGNYKKVDISQAELGRNLGIRYEKRMSKL